MPIELVTTPYGRPAAQRLRDAVARHKHDDPLRPVSVVVPTNYVGVAARRMLADGTLGPVTAHGAGIVGISFLTLYRLAELLGAPSLAATARRPVSTPVLAAAVRQVLGRSPGLFADVAEHPTTEQSLVAAYRELSHCDAAALGRIAKQGERAHDVVRVYRDARRLLEPAWFDERDLMDAAVDAITAGSPVLADVGALVIYLPQEVPEPAARMVGAVAASSEVTVIAGFTGDTRADITVERSLRRLGLELPATAGEIAPSHGTRVCSASDADDEVRTVVRFIVDAMREGVPLERMAVLYAVAEPYARLVHEHLDAAGIAHNGAAVRRLDERLLGRSLLALLALGDRNFRRDDVIALLASAPVRHRGRLVPAAAFDRVSRRAGVIGGPSQWSDRLDRYAREQDDQAELEGAQTEREPRTARYEREASYARWLRGLVSDLVADLAEAHSGRGWRAKVRWAKQLIAGYLADEQHRGAWPEVEQRAAGMVEAALDRLAGLDSVEPAPTLDVFRRTLELELDSTLDRIGRLGDGLVMGHVSLGLGLDLERVFVLGLAEGTFPANPRDDSLLPDSERRAAAGALALRAERVDDDHRMLLAVLAGTVGERVLTYPRGDLRRSTDRMPSRFLLDTVEALHGTRVYGDGMTALSPSWCTHGASFAAGVLRAPFPATAQEHRLRALLDHTDDGLHVASHALLDTDPVFARGLEAATARASARFTRFDGNLSHLSIPSPARPGNVVSPTRLEAWSACPHVYFMDAVLHVEIPDRPEEVYELSPLDRGSLVHEALDRFLTEVLDRPEGAPAPREPWTPADHARMHAIGVELCDTFEARGLTGRPVFWSRDRQRILAELDRFLVEDDAVRRTFAITPVATELRFGFADDLASGPPVDVPLRDGRVLHFRGAADRVDRGRDGALFVVDYKTGRATSYAAISEDNPDVNGTRLQLPVYAHAARARLGEPGTLVEAAYWFVSTREGFSWVTLPLTDAVASRIDEVLCTVVDGIEAGVFACPVEPPSTRPWRDRNFVDPDARGTRDRYRDWLRKRDAPELVSYRALAEAGAGEGDDDV